ncbi:MAG TPA: hypothetical protein VJN21_01475 [Candidatus Acidoferrales bacterium]|nr:hypothetical protein [Candidatus Acidoferrales bacterium]
MASDLIKLFRVDVLYPLADEKSINDFIASFSYLPWPNFDKKLFVPTVLGTVATFLDIYHVVRDLYESQIKVKTDPRFCASLFEWGNDDPLQDVFLTYFGGYPPRNEISKDYSDFVEKYLRGSRITLATDAQVEPSALKAVTPSTLTAHKLEWERVPDRGSNGVYVGQADDFEDIVNFWNLRAADVEVIFYDPRHQDRLEKVKDAFVGMFSDDEVDLARLQKSMAVWSKDGRIVDLRPFGRLRSVLQRAVGAGTWNGSNLKVARFHLDRSKSILGTVSDDDPIPELAIQLPEKPLFDEPDLRAQKVVVGVFPVGVALEQEESTFQIPYFPALNQFYGRRMYFNSAELRVGGSGPAIITSITTSHLNLRAIRKQELIAEIFKVFGMKAQLSVPGRIASRLIRQMGGIQGCRVFKIRGVRELLDNLTPRDSFDRTRAVCTIGCNDPQTGIPNFSKYKDLYIEYREPGSLRPEDAFLFLLKKKAFQVGLSFTCPHCELEPWVSLDDLTTEIKCEYCANVFLATTQLRDRNWKYRRSGLFGKENNQEGSIPVVLTLQQLDTILNSNKILTTNFTIEPVTAQIERCETDFVLLHQDTFDDKMSIAIGECKTRKEISDEDVRKLSRVADVFEENGVDSYIVFSKLASFTSDEIARCRAAQLANRLRVIMLTNRELEPYFVYEQTIREFEVQSSVNSLEGLAEDTDSIYFHPKPRLKPA